MQLNTNFTTKMNDLMRQQGPPTRYWQLHFPPMHRPIITHFTYQWPTIARPRGQRERREGSERERYEPAQTHLHHPWKIGKRSSSLSIIMGWDTPTVAIMAWCDNARRAVTQLYAR